MSHFMKAPCEHCPFRSDVKPFITAARGEELAWHAANPYNSFSCHKTTVAAECMDDDDENCTGTMMMATERSKECAGFLTLQINEGAPIPEGFTPAKDLVYDSIDTMIDHYNAKCFR